MNANHVVELGQVDGHTQWWCESCKKTAPGVGRNGNEKPVLFDHDEACNPPVAKPVADELPLVTGPAAKTRA